MDSDDSKPNQKSWQWIINITELSVEKINLDDPSDSPPL